ncbi:RHS repeat-associated core domain-containing protein [Marilutibacter chinensis]|uniref:Teneurin-like YD-shell domain-containing protein n=1 Tax=Marilutibacter chinensis TaxID=2912247 RepID=A0ABS9HUE3_9GAMM|nr:RHS repeat-associated core domain-containing protein [Lysobacter chinensis]MCF7222494.1 hypothetical protein [Lysobacter chinensis]
MRFLLCSCYSLMFGVLALVAPGQVSAQNRDIPASTAYKPQVAISGYLFSNGDEACRRVGDNYNSRENHGTTYANAKFAVHPELGVGCYYDETDEASGNVRYGQFRANWVNRKLVCPSGYNYMKNGGFCRRYDSPVVVDNKPIKQCVHAGNPIVCNQQSKLEIDIDQITPGFALRKTYRSVPLSPESIDNLHGRNWTSRLTRQLSLPDEHALPQSQGVIYSFREDGTTIPFVDSGAGQWVSEADMDGYLLVDLGPAGDERWVLSRPDGQSEHYDDKGRIVRESFGNVDVARYVRSDAGRIESIVDEMGRSIHINYVLSNGLIDSITAPDGAVFGYQYNDKGHLVGVLKGGEFKEFVYNVSGNNPYLVEVRENGVATASFSYDSGYKYTHTEKAEGLDAYSISYANYGLTATVVNPVGGETRYTFESRYGMRVPVLVEKLLDGQVHSTVQLGYDNRSNVAMRRDDAITECSYYDPVQRFRTAHFVFDATMASCPSDVQAAQAAGPLRGEVVTKDALLPRPVRIDHYGSTGEILKYEAITYNDIWRVSSSTVTDTISSESRTTNFSYCEAPGVAAGTCARIGNLLSVDGPRTDVSDLTSYQYYPADHADCAISPTTCAWRKGDLWKVTDALGHVTETLRYDGAGRVLSVRDANDVVTDFEYHPRGWMTARKVRGSDDTAEADDRITTIAYLPTGLVSSVTLPDGSFTSYVYDAAHRLTDIVDADGNRLHYTLDNAGNRIKEEVLGENDAVKRTLSRVYNQLGQLATQADAGANPTDFTYDANGNLKTTTDALDRVMQNDYDPLNRLIGTLQDVGGIEAATAFEYDALDNLTKVTDPKGLDTVYSYNGFGDLTQLDSPDTGITTYTYDAAGNRTGQTDARGETTTYGYDALNRLTSVSYSDSSLDVAYAYDTVQTSCATGETFAIGRLSRMSDGSGHTDYCYDRFGQLVRKVQVTDGQPFTLRYVYTKAGQLSRMTYPDGTEVDYVRDGQGRTSEIGVTAPGGSREVLLSNASWYPFGPVGAWTYGNGRTLSRTLDLDYRPQSILSTGTGSATSGGGGLDLGFGFDPVGNLTSLHGADRAEPPRVRLDYDGLSRLTAFRDGPTDTTIESYGYDATGNRTSFTNAGGTQAYSYPTDSHRLSAVAGVARGYDAVGNTTTIGTTREYVYNAANRLSAVKQGGAVTMNYGYNGRGERVHRHLGSDVTYSVYDEAGHWVGDYDASGAPKQQAIWLDDLPVGLLSGIATTANRLHYIEPDHLGTPRAVIEPQRDVAVWTWDIASEAFGNSAPSQDPDGDSTAFVLDMRFPGQRYDAASGLNYNYFRDYEAGTGRYSQSDPIGLSGGVSTYAYVRSSSLQHADPLGLVDHVSGRWIDCGKGCRIRIDFTFDGNTGQRTRHLHWECKGESGECGEFGKPSHGGTWDDAPRHIRECALRNGFSGQTSRDQEQRRTAPEMPEMSPGSKAAAAGAVVGAALVALFGYLVGG